MLNPALAFSPVLVTEPEELPITVDEAKAHLRVDYDEDDDLIEGLIASAAAHLDGWAGILGRALVTQTWRQDYRCFDGCMRLPMGPVQSVASFKYYDADNAQQTWSSGNYALYTDFMGSYVARLPSVSWPSVYSRADPVSITFVAGYGTPDQVPATIKAAIKLLVGHWYERREAVDENTLAELPLAVDRLISPYRRIGI